MFNIDKKTIYIIIGIIFLISIANMGTDGLLGILISLPAVIIAITFHEFAHAYVAYKLGDQTPMVQGRVNLNPLSHVDPLGLMLLIVAHFGWGRPVQINPNNFKGKYSISASEAIVSAAGPIMNFIIAIVSTIIYAVIIKFADASFALSTAGELLLTIVNYTIIINIGLGIFNLIPLPPLDGSKILMHFLPYNAKQWFEEKTQIFYFVFIFLFIFGIAGSIISPLINVIYVNMISLFSF